ncbi:MAG TPA: CsbD family protein [Acidimicrobiia bacterium]|nr:CsbD family protein [Acidimicrobiia bacterium]
MGDFESKKDEMKGRMKEAAGDMMDDDEMKREGKADRIGSTIKEKTNEVVDKAKDVIDRDR